MVSVKDIANACNVSVATVSKALNGYSDISDETKAVINAKAAELGYIPNMAAVALKTNRTYNIGILFVDAANSGFKHEYFANVLEGIRSQAEQLGYCITFITNRIGGRKITYSEYCRIRQFDGVIIACINYDEPQVIELVGSGIPIVTIDHIFNNTISVMSDNVKGVKDLVEYLYSMGHRRIAFLHGQDSSVTRDRVTSFYRCMEQLDLSIEQDYIQECRYHDTAGAVRCTKKLLQLKERPTCIMYPDDITAISGANVIKSHGLNIPNDISVTGYDGIRYSLIYEPQITTLQQAGDRMGREAASCLIELIKKPKTTLKKSYVIEGKVLTGASVSNLNATIVQ